MPKMLAQGDVRGPDFICVGAQKGGTRWLFDQLDHHPQFWMPPIKELHYFDLSQRYAKAAVPLYRRARKDLRAANRRRERKNVRPLKREDIAWLKSRFWLSQNPLDFDRYARLFNLRGKRLSGDICPPYAIIPNERAAAIRERFPDTKIIYLARDPVERLWSQYCMVVRRNDRRDPTELANVQAFVENGHGVAHSRVSRVVQRWRLQPNDDRFAFHFFDDLRKDATALRKEILQFLGAKEHSSRRGVPADFNRKKKLAKVVMPDAVRDYLVALFADEIRISADTFGGAAVDWQKKYDL
ncbi:MAG: sulfotransferase domain-containing protein [Hyphomicrobiales bacterium]|nr:sulfotransferase domain-containing protein [Hyphomicrobiales bacterium]